LVKESPKKQHFIVGEDETGLRLDVFLSRRQASLSRSQVPRVVAAGHVLLNDKWPKAGTRLKRGDQVLLRIPEPAVSGVIPENIPLNVIYEDSSLLVIDKPSGLVVHPGAGNREGTLVNALLYHCHDLSGIGGVLRPGIVHRLDKDTSGLMIVAKSDEIHRILAEFFEARQVEKHYLALVYGDVKDDEGVIDLPVGRHPVERKKMSTKSRKGKRAVTRWRVRERYGMATLLDVAIETGRTHQIRVHLAALGHSVVGDKVYGNSKRIMDISDQSIRRRFREMHRQALHASRLSFPHPVTGRQADFEAPLPQDMDDLCRFLINFQEA
jgi:23S rRNA pseudouridine1911/1915/1917 synthase